MYYFEKQTEKNIIKMILICFLSLCFFYGAYFISPIIPLIMAGLTVFAVTAFIGKVLERLNFEEEE